MSSIKDEDVIDIFNMFDEKVFVNRWPGSKEFIKANTGIIPRDIHQHNVLLSDDKIIFIDLGITESDRSIDIPMLERLDKRNGLG
jgi:tRNA A-37 threonylcarbamoyl transferase component Bud32